jgi:hypothetical protein
MQDPVHVFDTGLSTLGQPMADTALGHPQTFCEHHLRDAQLLHLGLDQLYPFIHVRHDTWLTPTIKTQIVVFKLSSQLRQVLF